METLRSKARNCACPRKLFLRNAHRTVYQFLHPIYLWPQHNMYTPSNKHLMYLELMYVVNKEYHFPYNMMQLFLSLNGFTSEGLMRASSCSFVVT